MFTPPPQSEADAVRVMIGYYDPVEVLMAYHMQTNEGQPWNVRLFFSQYQTVDEYMEHNSATDIAGQIDWWTRTRIYNAQESLVESHLGNYECYFTAHNNSWLRPVDRNSNWFWECQLPTLDDGWEFLGIDPEPFGIWCNYEPEQGQIAYEIEEMHDIWREGFSDDMDDLLHDINAHPKFEGLMRHLNFYAKERRALAEAQEREPSHA